MKKLLLGIFFTFLFSTSFATVIYIIILKNRIIMGTDSREVVPVGNQRFYRTTNKIVKAGKYYFAFQGLSSLPQANFYAQDYIATILKNGKNFGEIKKKLQTSLLAAMQSGLADYKKHEPQQFAAEFRRPYMNSLFIIHRENSSVLVYEMWFSFQNSTDSVIDKIEYTEDLNSNSVGDTPQQVGVNYDPRKLDGVPLQFVKSNPREAVKIVVQNQINSGRDMYGGPIDILDVTDKDAHYYSEKSKTPKSY